MKKILMVLTFLLMVAMVPAAHAKEYILEADDIWYKTDIYLTVGQSITFSGGRTYTTLSKIPTETYYPDLGKTVINYVDRVNGWTSDGAGGYYRDKWTWGVNHYAQPDFGVPYVWTGADGGEQGWESTGLLSTILGYDVNIGLQNDEWFSSVLHGMLIGYIGGLDPLLQGGIMDKNEEYLLPGSREPNLGFRNNDNLFGIGAAAVTITAKETGYVWIGMNDDFVDYNYGPEDNFGYATVNIPEPASMLLLFFGLMGVLGLRRKFKS